MPRLNQLQQDIERCQGQIAMTFDAEYMQNYPEDYAIVREAFQNQLKKLLNEKEIETLRCRAEATVNNTIQGLQAKTMVLWKHG